MACSFTSSSSPTFASHLLRTHDSTSTSPSNLNSTMHSPRLISVLTFVGLILVTIYILYPSFSGSGALLPANSTLGFGTILAVSQAHSPRRSGLLWAANLTNLAIEIPDQPRWTEGDFQAFTAEDSTISKGSAFACMGHLNALRRFLDTSHETALIIEDDTDFSLHIRQTQIPLLAAAVRTLFDSISASPNDYWGPRGAWQILYPGHCDDLPQPIEPSHLAYHDPTSPAHTSLHPATQSFLTPNLLPPQTRILHRTRYPFCTFAYAVTRESAVLILERFSKEKESGISAYDVQLLEACTGSLGCWSVVPELFHHVVGASEIGRQDAGGGGRVGVEVPDRGTWNVECGARDKGVWVDEADREVREEVKKLIGDMVVRSECPIDKLDSEKDWRGCEWEECGAQS
ncbi:hypothetical protein HBI56_206510 [Parastagonospora nodorum]|nr:hypothetical protein HBI06_224920 [Parastagonospora nodorum]KAH4228543.1 hypothetical protein HBI05_202990 [Parastagonospora nodorum]KAH5063644.1 hypothetical protein HBI73_202900 [Parastagonospora nodorum]KAH5176586.1 hypothetical protein HBH76_212290 [Parastagonospora nodorum]KAH5668742.1 hypothetical protein HBI21_209050 [Parastagonospora nodorum]